MKISDSQKQKIKEIGKKFNLKLMLVYGSYANGKHREESDLDIACLGKKPIDFDAQLNLYSALTEVFGDIERELDVVVLREKDPLFLYQIAKNSQLIYGNQADYNEFRAFAFRNYIDSKDIRDLEKKLVFRYQEHLNKTYAR